MTMNISDVLFYIAVTALTFTLTVLAERLLIPLLKRKAKQPIYAEGPDWHLAKSGTPTMGGLGFIAAISVVSVPALLFLHFRIDTYFAVSAAITIGYGLMNALIGAIDDIAKIRKNENAGLTPIQKLALQTIAATAFLIARRLILGDSDTVYFSFGKLDLGIFYYPIALIMLLGTVNCANLTDGVDGISAGVAFSYSSVLALLYAPVSSEVGFISFALIGASIGFLVFNLHPAKIFMGDTGSLFLGAVLSAVCISLGNPLIAVFIGAVYLIEGLSVIIQVFSFKISGRRIFKMAPLHHHLEKCGFSENKIVIIAMISTVIASSAVLFLFV
jgi:phospho-N-acetylmuramoyl-pentapeptide-transferase